VFLVPLYAIHSSELLVAAIAETLGIVFSGARAQKAQLLDALRERQLLLVLDGFEHLLAAATLVSDVARNTMSTRVLVTSRERLNVADEAALELHGLVSPPDADISRAEEHSAVRLFIERARRSDPRFEPAPDELRHVGRVCRLVGGLPLGVEIAASMIRVLSCREIAEELTRNVSALTSPLRDVPERHRSLRAVFEQSWAALNEAEQGALMRLSILCGAFRREAAAAVGAELPVLTALLDKSLVHRRSEGRFGLHDVIRQLAALKLQEDPELRRTATEALSVHFAQAMRALENEFFGPKASMTLETIAEDMENIRAGWRHAVEQGRRDLIRQYFPSLARFYYFRGRFEEGNQELSLAEPVSIPGIDTALLLARRATLCLSDGDFPQARDLCRRALAMLRDVAPDSGEAGIALAQLGHVALLQGWYRAAMRIFDRALRLLLAPKVRVDRASCLINLGTGFVRAGRYVDGERTFEEARRVFHDIADARSEAIVLTNLAVLLTEQARYEEARQLRQQALHIAKSLSDEYLVAACLLNLGESSIQLGENDQGRSLITQSLEYWRSSGRQDGVCVSHLLLGQLEYNIGNLPSAEGHLRLALRAGVASDELPHVIEVVTELAHVLAAAGNRVMAARLATAVLGHSATPDHHRRRAQLLLPQLTEESTGASHAPESDSPSVSVRQLVDDLLAQDGDKR
jgi:predicted ATPase/Tfp pilus assembly protein PilF